MNEDLVATIRADLSQFRAEFQQSTRIVQQTAQQSAQHLTRLDTSIQALSRQTQGLGTSLKTVGQTATTALGQTATAFHSASAASQQFARQTDASMARVVKAAQLAANALVTPPKVTAGRDPIDERLSRYQKTFGTIRKLQDELQARERALADKNILGLNPQQIRLLGNELEALRAKLQRTLDPTGFQRQRQAATEASRAIREKATADRRAADDAARHGSAMQRLSGAYGTTTGVIRQFAGTLAAVGIIVSIRELLQLGGAAIQASTQMVTLQNAFKTITGSTAAATAELAFVRAEAARLGVSFLPLAQGFQGITAAAKGTVLEGAGVREILLGITEAGRVMGLGTEQISRLMVGLQQIMGKGVVQMEEWRQQIGEALPQATRIFAQELGVTTARFFKMVEAGEVGLPELQRFATALRRDVAGGVEAAGKTFQAAQGRISTAVSDLLVAFGDIITKNPQVIDALNSVAAGIARIAETIETRQGVFGTLIAFFEKVLAVGIPAFKELSQVVSAPLLGASPLLDQINQLNDAMLKQQEIINNLKQQNEGTIGQQFFNAFRIPGLSPTLTEEIQQASDALTEMSKKRQQLLDQVAREQRIAANPLGFDEPGREPQIRTGRQLRGLIQERNLPALQEQLKAYTKQREEIERITKLIDAHTQGFVLADPNELQVLNAQLVSAKDTLAKLIDPEGVAAGKKALSEAASEAKRFATAIDNLAGPSLQELDKQYAALGERLKTTNVPGELEAIRAAMAKIDVQRQALATGGGFTEAMKQQLQLQEALAETTKAEAAQLDAQIALAEASGTAHAELLEQRLGLQRKLATEEQALQQARLAEELDTLREHGTTIEDLQIIRAERERQIALDGSAAQTEISQRAVEQALTVQEVRTDVELQIQQAIIATTQLEAQQLDAQLEAFAGNAEERQALLAQRIAVENTLIQQQTTIQQGELAARLTDLKRAQVDDSTITRLKVAEETRILKEGTASRGRIATDEAKRAQEDFKRQVDRITEQTSGVIFTWLDGLTSGAKSFQDLWEDTLNTVKDLFFKVLADMAAKALTEQILIRVGTQFLGGGSGGGFGGGAGGFGGGGGVLGYLQQAQQLYNLGQGLFGGAAAVGGTALGAAGSGVYGGALAGGGSYLSINTAGGAVLLDASGSAAAGSTSGLSLLTGTAIGGGLTVGTLIAGVGAGIGVGLGASQLLEAAGVGGTTNRLLSGAAGGATAGFIAGTAVPVVGPVLGAVAGAVIGTKITALIELLGRGKSDPTAHLQLLTALQPGADFLDNVSAEGPFGFVGAGARYSNALNTRAIADFFVTVDESLAGYLSDRQDAIAAAVLQQRGQTGFRMNFDFDKPLEDIAGAFIRDRMGAILEGLARDLGGDRANALVFRKNVLGDFPEFPSKEEFAAMEASFAEAVQFLEVLGQLKDPAKPLGEARTALKALNDTFDALAKQARDFGVGIRIVEQARRRDITTLFENIVDSLRDQQDALLQGIDATRRQLEEGLFTPAETFVRRQTELEDLQTEFMAATPGQQVAMAPTLLARIQELFQLGQNEDVFGQDLDLLKQTQQDLLAFIADIEQVAGRDAFDQQIALAQQQADLMSQLLVTTDRELKEANRTLLQIEKFLKAAQKPFVGEFQSGGVVPATGMALVHRGEMVVPAGHSPTTTIHMPLTVNIQGGGASATQTGRQIAEAVWPHLENMARLRRIPLKLSRQ